MERNFNCIYKRKDGRYETRFVKKVKEGGKKIYGYVQGNSYRDVKIKKIRLEAYYKEKSYIESYEQSFNCKIDNWLNNKKPKIKMSSYTTYVTIVENRIRPIFGSQKLGYMKKDTFNNYIILLQQKKELSLNTIHDIAIILKQIITYNNLKFEINVPPKLQKEISVFTTEDIKIIEKRALTYNNRYIFGIILSLYTGIRIGELCALKKSDFDLRNLIMRVEHTVIRVKNNDSSGYKTKVIYTNPKSKKSVRVIPIPDILRNYLRHYLKNMSENNFFLTNSDKAIEPRSYSNIYHRFLKYWGIKNKKFHTTRHTFATKADETQMSTKALSEILGHSSTSITQSLYIHPSLNYKRNCINNIYMKKAD